MLWKSDQSMQERKQPLASKPGAALKLVGRVVKMRKYEKELLQDEFDREREMLKKVENIYKEALALINDRIKILTVPDGMYEPSKIRWKQYQEQLKRQIGTILKGLQEREVASIREYLNDCYYSGVVGTVYSLQKQGVPLILPIEQELAVKAISHETKLRDDLDKTVAADMMRISKNILPDITRGIAQALVYGEIARNVANSVKIGQSNAARIARTEGHRIQQAARHQTQQRAKAAGVDIVKVWNATLDGNSRDTHRLLHGQVREINEPFSANGKKAMYPGKFNDPAEDCNCRCVADTQVRTAQSMDDAIVRKCGGQIIQVKAENLKEFKRQYSNVSK